LPGFRAVRPRDGTRIRSPIRVVEDMDELPCSKFHNSLPVFASTASRPALPCSKATSLPLCLSV